MSEAAETPTARQGFQGRVRQLRTTLGGELLTEFFGTFMLVLIGCGSVAVAIVGLSMSARQTAPFGPANWLIINWGWGFAVAFGVYVAGGVSGAHINPAVTFAFALRLRFPWRKVVPYWAAQVAGGLIAAAVVYAVYFPAINAFMNVNNVADRSESLPTFAIFATYPAPYFGGDWVGPFIDQIVGTAILVSLIVALIDRRNVAPASNIGPFLIGMIVTVIGMSFGTGAGYAINPARDLGPRIWTYIMGWGELSFPGTFDYFANYWWIPIAGPLAGGAVGILVYEFFAGRTLYAETEEEAPRPGRP